MFVSLPSVLIFSVDNLMNFFRNKMEKRSDKTNSGNEETNKYPPSDSISIKDGVDITDTQTEDVQCSDEPLTLDKLPVEILMYICSYLDAKFLVHSLSKVCRSFQDLFVSDIYWKIRIKKRWSKPYPTVYSKLSFFIVKKLLYILR